MDKPLLAGISYLNSRPYFHPFLTGSMESSFRIELMTPAGANEALLTGRAVGGLVSSIAWARARNELHRVPGLEIASLGEVLSIILISRGALTSLNRVAVTAESATSVEMLRILLARRGNFAELATSPDPMGDLESGLADGALLIGDSALASGEVVRRHHLESCDLGLLWHQDFNLPMVYAVFAVRKDCERLLEAAEREMRQALDWSRERLDEILLTAYNIFPDKSAPDKSAPEHKDHARLKRYLEQFAAARLSGDLDAGLEAFLSRALSPNASGKSD